MSLKRPSEGVCQHTLHMYAACETADLTGSTALKTLTYTPCLAGLGPVVQSK